MPYSYDDAAESDTAADDSARMVDNPKLLAIHDVKDQATISQTSLASWTPTSQTSLPSWIPTSTTDVSAQPGASFNAGLTEDVWTSPVADDYRTKIGLADSGAEEALARIVSDLTDAENAIYNAGEDKVSADSDLAKWPNT